MGKEEMTDKTSTNGHSAMVSDRLIQQLDHISAGKSVGDIDVLISYKIIQLFSEGLYRSPHKAIEELVANAYDAGATTVEVKFPLDLSNTQSTIVVADDGIGMDEDGLRAHWLIGESNKRNPKTKPPRQRLQIGKFGIGKLATYVLANELTHICRQNGKYFATSMDYRNIPKDTGAATGKVKLPLRLLSESEAKKALTPWLDKSGQKVGALRLFGRGASASWTVAILSSLKDLAVNIQPGRLNWILSTAMPLRDDFELVVNSFHIRSPNYGKAIKRWVLGKDITELPKPAPEELSASSSKSLPSDERFGFNHPQLGRITGYFEIYRDLLTEGKAAEVERSHGFFVYVHGRLVNIEDEYFGLDSNLLRHGTFSRFRAVVHINRLDSVLRSSREAIQEGPLFNQARNFLHAIFLVARNELKKQDESETPEQRVSRRFAASPSSLTSRPVLGLVQAILDGKYIAKFFDVPINLDSKGKKMLLARLQDAVENSESGLLTGTELVARSPLDRIAVYDVSTGKLAINTLHPFVAHFRDEFESAKLSLPLELVAMAEVLFEASLFQAGVDAQAADALLSQRDQLLRFLANSSGNRNAYLVSQGLLDSATDADRLESELVAAFNSMGFEAVPIGKRDNPDGVAHAYPSPSEKGSLVYKVSLEAKSKEELGKKVSAKHVGVSAIARQRKKYGCDHAIVVGPDFPAASEEAAVVKEIRDDNAATGKSITLMRIADLARLVQLVPQKRLSLVELRDLFTSCVTPDESRAWVDAVEARKIKKVPYKAILEEIWSLGKENPGEPVEFKELSTALRRKGIAEMNKQDLYSSCHAIAQIATGHIHVTPNSVELRQKPEILLKILSAARLHDPELKHANE